MTLRLMLKACSVAALIVLVGFALGPAKWTPRSGLGFEFDHFVGSSSRAFGSPSEASPARHRPARGCPWNPAMKWSAAPPSKTLWS